MLAGPHRLDRLGRSVRHVIDTVHNLGERGIAFRSLTEGFDTNTAGGEFLFRIMAALAQMERRMIVERTHAGFEAARRQGRHGGRPTVMTPERTELARTLR
ncbi:recombinase family protein [Rhodococcus erythropolis]|uniref:recombinase family protein n=1 Tax=Rhodococcus erythropolis TaxID=1833 RepID=UPI00355B577F